MSDGGGHGGGGGKRRGHEEEHEEHENHERWLVSYADMMTLLMVLFIVMFAISQVDTKKFMALKTGLQAGFGSPLSLVPGGDALLETGSKLGKEQPNLNGVAGSTSADPKKSQSSCPTTTTVTINTDQAAQLATATQLASVKGQVSNLKQAQAALQKALQVAGLAKGATFRFDERGLVISIATDKVLFDSGSADLSTQGRRILDALAPTLRKLPNRLSVDGHTDPTPIATAQFPSNWELSSDRATGVLRYLASGGRIAFGRMSATGFADTKPLVEGTSAAAFAADRRVEIVVLAMLDDSAGRAVAQLGNSAPIGSTTGTDPAAPAAGPSPSADPSASPSPSTSPTPTPTPEHNLLGPDPTPTPAGATTPAASTPKATPRTTPKATPKATTRTRAAPRTTTRSTR